MTEPYEEMGPFTREQMEEAIGGFTRSADKWEGMKALVSTPREPDPFWDDLYSKMAVPQHLLNGQAGYDTTAANLRLFEKTLGTSTTSSGASNAPSRSCSSPTAPPSSDPPAPTSEET